MLMRNITHSLTAPPVTAVMIARTPTVLQTVPKPVRQRRHPIQSKVCGPSCGLGRGTAAAPAAKNNVHIGWCVKETHLENDENGHIQNQKGRIARWDTRDKCTTRQSAGSGPAE